jgi:HD-GYP domain-containing protein (c-di-GMP phosphodiesterase class II)
MGEEGGRAGDLLTFARDARARYRDAHARYIAERQRVRDLERELIQLNEASVSMIETLAVLIEAKDAGTRQHLDRTRELALKLTERIEPALTEQTEIAHAFLLHDIGKVGIPDRILTKPGPLTESEWAVMRTHPLIGAHVVGPMRLLADAEDVVRCHHERFDGTGYPHGFRGAEIPLAARIFSVVDAYDAMTNDRPYRAALPREEAIRELARCSGTQFDPRVVDVFVPFIEEGAVPDAFFEQQGPAAAVAPA